MRPTSHRLQKLALTLNPALQRKVLRKVKEQGVDMLNPKERKIWRAIERQREQVELRNTEAALLSKEEVDALYKKKWANEITEAESRKLKAHELAMKAQFPPDQNDMSLLLTDDPGAEKFVSTERNKQLEGAASKLLVNIRALIRLRNDLVPKATEAIAADDQVDQVDPKLKATIEEAVSLIRPVFDYVDHAEELINNVRIIGKKITFDNDNYPQYAKAADRFVEEAGMGLMSASNALSSIREFRKTTAEQHKKLFEVFQTRYRSGVEMFVEQGASKEEASKKVLAHPMVQKMHKAVIGMFNRVKAVDVVLHLVDAPLESMIRRYKNLRTVHDDFQGEFGTQRSKSASTITKRLAKVAKTLLILRYLENKSTLFQNERSA